MTVGSLTSFATPAEVNALVEAFGFKTSSGGGDRSLKLTFNDGGNVGGGPGLTDTVTQIVHVTVANIAPTLDLGATPGTVPERTATALAPSLTLSDVDGNTLLSAKVQLTTGYVSGEDVLGFTNTANIQGAFVAATGTLTITFSGTPTDGEFQTFLRSVTYTDTSHTPTTASRTVVFTVQDAGGTANSGHDTTVASATFNVSAVNEAPVLSQTSNTVGFTENGTAVQLLPTESVSDPDLPANFNNGSVLVTLTGSVAGDGIGLLASSGFTVNAGVVKDNGTTIGTVHAGTGFGTASVQVDLNTSATAAEVAALLKALSYASSSDDPTGAPRTATVTFNDGGNTGSGVQTAVATVTINVTPVNDAPTLSATGANPAFTEGGAAATLFSGALASTIEAGQTITALRLTVSNVADGASEIINIDGHDVPLVNGTVNAGTDVITVSISGTTATVTLTNATGISAAATASLVNAITYRDTSDNPNTANRTVTLTAIKDNGGTSPGVDTTALSIASTVSVGAVNDAPTATLPGTHYSATERTPLDLKNTLSVADVDGNNGIETVTLSVTEGTLTLAAGTSGATITNNGSAAVTINGTVAQINDLLNTNATSAVSYIDNSHNPAAHATLTLTINDNGNTGSGVTAPGTATAIIDIAPVNDAPVLDPAKVPALGAIAEDAGAPGIGSGILVASLVDLNPPAGGLDNVTDVDSTVTGIALIGADSSHGTWLYSIDNGAHWAAVGSVSDGSARLLAADGSTRLYFQPAADFNGAVNPALTFRAWDRSSGSNGDANANAAANGGATAFSVDSVSTSLVVTPVNDAPVLTVAGTHAAGTEQVFGVLDGSATVSDKDLDAFNGGAGDYSGASLIIARHSGANAQDAFAFGASALFTVSGNELQSGGQAFATFTSVGGVLTINFTSAGTAATTALVNDVIDHVTYANQSDTPPPSVTLDINFSDGNGNGAQGAGGRLIATAGRTIDITAVNDAPVNTVPGSQTALQDTSLAIAGLSVFDVDADPANDIVTVTLGVGHGSLTVATDQLTGLNESIGGNGTGSVILTGTQDHINATLAEAGGLVYLGDLGFSGNDVLTVTTDDGGHTGTGPGVATGTVSILVTPTANVNAPQLALTDNGSFTEGQASPASVVTAATVTDTSATTLEGATVTISGGFLAGDTLTAGTTIAGITASYANGVLTLSGHATLADYNTVLSSIQFSTASHNPTLYGTDATRTLTWIVNDGSSSGSTTSTIAVTGVDDAPVNQVPGAQTASEDRTLAITGLSVSDVDANPASDIITVTLSVGHGSLTAATNLLTGIGESVTGNGSGSVTLTGTQHDINATLAEANGLVYLGDTNFNGSDSLTIVTDDGGHTPAPAQQATDHVAINVLSVNDAPSGADTTVSVIVNTSRVLTAGDFHFNDVDGNSLQAVEITSLPTAGSLTNHGTAVFAGQFISLADITGGNLVFTPAAGGPASPYATFTFQVQDDGGTANGGVDLDPVARTITLNTVVSQPPVLSNVAPTAAFTENDPAPVLLSSGLDVTDSDSPNLSKATVTISAGLLAGDELSIAGSMTGVSGTISWNFSGGTLTLQGLATAADYKTLLDQVAYRSTSADPTNGGADGSRSIDWVATDSAGVPSLAATTHVTVTAVNNDPVASIATPNYGPVDEQASLSLKNTGISVGDVDGNTGSETVTLAVDDGILNVTAGTSGATVLNSGTSSVTITGSVAQIQALLNTDPTSTVAFVDTNHTPHASVALTLTIHDNGSTGGTDLSSVATATIAVNPVNDAPVASITQPVYNAVEQTVLDLHGTGISVSDVDSQGGTETVTLSVGEGTLALNAGSTGAIVSGPGASVTITGTLAQINAVLNGDLASSLTYIDNTDTPGAGTTLTLAVDDQGNTGAPGARIGTASVTIVIAPVDDAPTTADAVVTISEDATRTFAASDFPFADVENNALQSVIIAGLPAHGTLTLNGSTFAAGTSIAAAQIANLVYTPNADFNGTDTFTFKVQDNGNGNGLGQDISAVATMTVTVNSVNDAPTAAASSVTTSEDAPRTFLASDFGFTDAHDNPPNALQAVIIETLPANGTLKLNGIDVTANQTILASDLSNLVYTPNADFNGTDGFTFDVRDDGGTALGGHDTSTNAALMSISVVSVNDAPTAAASARTIDEDTPVNFAASDFHFTDAHDNPSNALQAVVIGALPGSGTLTLNGHAVAANDTILATDLANLVYTPNLNFNGSDTFTFAVRDDGGTALGGHDTSTNTATMTITVNPVNDAPVLSGVKTSAAFTPGGMAVTLSPPPVLVTDPALSVTDVDNTTLAGATVRVSAGTFLGDGDVLSVNGATVGNIGAITFSYNAGNETLTLTGTDTLAHYQQVLEQVQFLSTSFNPTNSGAATSRTIIWQLDDGSGAGNHNLSAPVDSQIFLHTLDLDSATAGTDYAAAYTEGGTVAGGTAAAIANLAVITDNDSDIASATVTLVNARPTDLLSFVGAVPPGITVSGNGTSVLTFTGTALKGVYEQLLDDVRFSSTSGNIDTTIRDVAVSVTDLGGIETNIAHTAISITAVNDAPTVDPHGGSLAYTENDAPTPIDPLLTITDPDSANINGATVKITGNFHASEDVLGFANQNGISGSYDSVHGVLTLTGASSVANYEAALKSVTYFNSSDKPSNQARTISFQAVDDGGASSTVATATVSVAPVNDAPVMTGLTASVGFTENGAPVTLSPGITVADVDSSLLTGAKVAITGGFVDGDTLDVVAGGTITASYDGATGVLTLTGQATPAQYRAVLASISFTSTSDNPTSFGTRPTRTITWSLTDLDETSAAHANATGTAVTHVAVTAINDAPVIDAGQTLPFNANAGLPMAIDPAIALHDVDSLTLVGARVAVVGGFEAANDSLGFVNQHGIAGTYDSATGVLTLSGTASVADYQAALASVTFASITQASANRTIQWTVDDGGAVSRLSAPAMSTLNVSGIILPPHVFTDNHAPPAQTQGFTPASFVDSGPRGPLVPLTGGDSFGNGFGTGGSGNGFHVVHTDAVLTTASDATVQINLALAALEAPLGGDIAYVVARQANGDPLPDWLKFDPATGTFAGLPPDNLVASIEPEQSLDNNIVTGALPLRPDLGITGPNAPAKPLTITVEVLARDSKGNIAVTVFTIDLRTHTAGKQGWNIDRNARPLGGERHASLPMISPELAAIEAALRDVAREPWVSRGTSVRHGDSISAGSGESTPAGRAGLTEQLASIGWRSMAAQRNALLASLQQPR
jgi:hypothetical protein